MKGSSFSHSDYQTYAKSDGTTLHEHRKNCLASLNQIRTLFEDAIREFLIHFGVKEAEFWNQISFTVSNHDFGKINNLFQEKIRNIMGQESSIGQKLKKDIPHNYISPIFFINEKLFHLREGDEINYGALAAMYHHGPIRGIKALENRGIFDRQQTIKFQGFRQYYYDDLDQTGLIPEEKIVDYMSNCLNSVQLKDFLNKKFLEPATTDSDETVHARRWIFPLFKQLLHLSDWIGSGAKFQFLAATSLWDSTSNVLAEKKMNATKLREKLLAKSSCIPSRAILESPTGSGKTEAAIKWADRWNKPRLIFTLPTRSLVDDIYLRFQGTPSSKGYFQSKTGILHSTSEYTYNSNQDDDPESHDFDRYFHRPVMVTTIDQILISLFNSGRWDAVNFSLSLGSLVVDEVHAYDMETMSLIIELIRQTRIFGMPILLMSATLPRWLPKAINEIAGEDFPVINVRNEEENKLPWSLEIKDRIDLNEILNFANKSDVIVVCNNVRSSVEIFKEIHKRHNNTKLINSRFIQQDRSDTISWAKSRSERFKILVSTQVIEVGIDIDFGTLFSEVAPMDVLVQRCGRVNRSGNPARTAKVFVYMPEEKEREIDDLIYGKDHIDRTLRELKKGIDTNERIAESLGSVYPEKEELEILKSTYSKMHNKVIFAEKYEQRDGIHSIPLEEADLKIGTRERRYVSILAVPEEFSDIINSHKWKEFAISVPVSSFSKFIDRGGRFPIIRLKYSHETGLEIPSESVEKDAFFI